MTGRAPGASKAVGPPFSALVTIPRPTCLAQCVKGACASTSHTLPYDDVSFDREPDGARVGAGVVRPDFFGRRRTPQPWTRT